MISIPDPLADVTDLSHQGPPMSYSLSPTLQLTHCSGHNADTPGPL